MTNYEPRVFQDIIVTPNDQEWPPTHLIPRVGKKYYVERVRYGDLKVGDILAGKDPYLVLTRITKIMDIPRKRLYKEYFYTHIQLTHTRSDNTTFSDEPFDFSGEYHIRDHWCWRVTKVED